MLRRSILLEIESRRSLEADTHSYVQTDMGATFATAIGVKPPMTPDKSAVGILKQVSPSVRLR
jgi:hypothetical protein